MNTFTCLMYHETTLLKNSKYSVSMQTFEKQVQLLRKWGIHSCFFDQQIAKESSAHYCTITFDDGHVSNYEAAKILYQYGYQGIFYVIKNKSLTNPEFLTETQIKEIADMGHLIGVHGKSHKWWTKFPDEVLTQDLLEVKNWIESLTGKPVITCAAPGGVIDQRVINCLQKNIPDMEYIRTVKPGINKSSNRIIQIAAIHSNTYKNEFKLKSIGSTIYYQYLSVIYFIKQIIKKSHRIVHRFPHEIIKIVSNK